MKTSLRKARLRRKPTKDYVCMNSQCPKVDLVVSRHANIRVPRCGDCHFPLVFK